MSLSKDTLISALTEAFDPMPATLDETAERWHVAYYTYARQAQLSYGGYQTIFVPTGEGNKAEFIKYIKIAFTPTQDPLQAPANMAIAFSSFWIAPIDELFIPVPPVLIPLTSIPNPDISAFTSMSFDVNSTQENAVKMIATGVHTYTQGIQVAGLYLQPGIPPLMLPFTTTIS